MAYIQLLSMGLRQVLNKNRIFKTLFIFPFLFNTECLKLFYTDSNFMLNKIPNRISLQEEILK